MIKNIKDLNFNKNMEEYINNVEECFNLIAKEEHNQITMLSWINNNLKEIESDGVLEGFSDREKFLFAFTILSNEIERKVAENTKIEW